MAFVQKTTTPTSFTGGFQSKTDQLQLLPPSLLELQNGMFSKIGALNKRYGFETLSLNVLDGGILNSAFAIDAFNNELNLFDNNNIYTYIESTNQWSNRGTAISLVNTNNQITRSVVAQQLNPDVAFLQDLEIYVYEDSRPGGARYSVVDHDTQAYVVADQELSGFKPKAITINGLAYLFYTDNICNIFYHLLNPNNPSSLGPQINIVADGYASSAYDIVVDSAHVFVAYTQLNGSSQPEVLVKVFDLTMTAISTITVDTNSNSITGADAVNVYVDSENQLWVSYAAGTNVKTAIYDATTFSTILSPTIIDNVNCATLAGIEFTTPGTLQLTYEVFAADNISSDQYIRTALITNTGSTNIIGTLRSVGLMTKPFKYNNNLYINVTHQSNEQSTYFTVLLNNEPFTVVGKVAPQVGGGLRTNNMLGEVVQPSAGVFLWSNLIKGQFISEAGGVFTLLGCNSTVTDFTDVNKFNSVTSSDNLLFVGGILQSYDGFSANEQNFHLFPEGTQTNVVPTGGALSVGQYEYQVLYAWSDKFGKIQYSTPSDPIIVTVTVPDSVVEFIIPTLRLTAKTGVVIQLYRTQVNGTVLQEVTSTLAPLKNDPTVDYVSFIDAAADIEIAGNAPIYTTGGILPNSAPPSCSLISLYQNRVMVAGLENKNQIWFSKNKVNNSTFNTIPVEFSSSFTIDVDPRGGPITALGLMDANLIIFKPNAIFLLSGDGPNDQGTAGQFPDPVIIPSNIGCANPNSLILIDEGLIFQTPNKGIWLLNRSLNVTYIGQGVDDFNDLTISSATLDQNDNIVIFNTYQGATLVYDYFIQQWSSWVGAPTAVVDGVNFGGVFCFAKANGQVYQQNRTSFVDGPLGDDGYGRPIVMEFTTPWLSWAGMQGWQSVFRAFLLGTYRGPHQLNVSVGYNFNGFFQDTATIDATSLAGANQWGSDGYWGESTPWGSTFQPYEFQINFKTQKCTALRMKISDSPSSPYTEGYTISNLNFEVGILGDGIRLPAVNKVGTT